MSATRSTQDAGTPRLEPLEPRILLSDVSPLAALAQVEPISTPPGLIVSPLPEQEPNDDLTSAQALAFSWLVPNVSSLDGCGPQQAAVSGTADGAGGVNCDRTRLLFGIIAYPYSFSLGFADVPAPDGGGVLTVTGYADLQGTSKYLTVEAEGILLGDVFVFDGQYKVPVTTEVSLTPGQLAALAADGVITFSFTPSSDMTDVGTSYVKMQLTYGGGGAGTSDFYSFDLGADESASLAVTSAGSGQVELGLYDAAGTLLASAQTDADNPTAAIANFLPGQAGTYYLGIAGEGEYTLIVNRNATLDLQTDGSLGSAQEINSAKASGRQWAIGEVGGAETDFYALTLGSQGMTTIRAYAPDGGTGANLLEPVLNLYDADGKLVATSDGSKLQYHVPKGDGGVYYVEVAAADDTGGDYVLSVKSQLQPLKPDKPGLRVGWDKAGGPNKAAG